MQPEPAIVSRQELGEVSQQAVSQAYQSAIHVLQGDFSSLSHFATKHLVPATMGVLGLVVAYFVAQFVSRLCSMPIRQRIDETLGRFVGKLVFYAIMVATAIWVISSQGFDVTSFAAVLAAAGFYADSVLPPDCTGMAVGMKCWWLSILLAGRKSIRLCLRR